MISVQYLCAQELPPVQNFSPADYNGQNQNWAISQAEDKTIYISNNKGLLTYNGADWELYNSPNETIMRSVNVIDGKIYTGCYMEFGFWQKDEFGKLKYQSISEKIKNKLIDDEQFWNIIAEENSILFQSLNRIYIFNTQNSSFKIIDSKNSIVKMYKTNSGIYFQRINDGLYKIENGKDILVSNNSIIQENRIINIFDLNDSLLIQTADKGFFVYSSGSFRKWKDSVNALLSDKSVYSSLQLKDGSFVIGTISNGIIHINQKGEYNYQINQSKGLNDNTILSMFEDVDHNLWLGLDNGIGLVHQNSPYTIYNDYEGKVGSVYASVVYNKKLYLGTNQGLFYKPSNTSEFKIIKGTEGQVWCLKEFDNSLFMGHDLGTFIIENNKATKIVNVHGAWEIKRNPNKKNELIQGNYDGLYVLSKNNNKWSVKNKIDDFNISSRYFEFVKDNTILVSHEYKGVLKLVINKEYTKVESLTEDTVHKGLNSSLVTYQNTIYYAYKKGVFKYNKTKEAFEKDSILSTIYSDGFISGKLIVDENTNEMWGFSKNNINHIQPSKLSSTLKINKIPLTNSNRLSIIGYENILKTNQDSYILGSTSGYIQLNLSNLIDKDFQININEISQINNEKNKLINGSLERAFSSDNSNITFSYSTPEYNKYFKTSYQYKLEGLYNNWSRWNSNSSESFKNLPSGNYQFFIRAKIGNKVSTNIASYSFKIKKPWYLTNFMITVYLLSIILFSLFMHVIYKKYYKNQQKRLLEKKNRELKLTQIENEKEIIKIKNEQLQKEYKTKSKELAASIMNISKKNELLTQIKSQLSDLKDQTTVNRVVKVISKNLKHNNDDWEFFQEAFNNADSEFLKKIKIKHKNLSPNDLKLCAYLRLNLSSKEIAPLFNISVRSIEIKRYRLRKKMNLSPKENLVNYILSI